MDIVKYNHPMLVIETFEILRSHNPGMCVPHAMGYMLDTKEPAYVVFPTKELSIKRWVSQLSEQLKNYPQLSATLARKWLESQPNRAKVADLQQAN